MNKSFGYSTFFRKPNRRSFVRLHFLFPAYQTSHKASRTRFGRAFADCTLSSPCRFFCSTLPPTNMEVHRPPFQEESSLQGSVHKLMLVGGFQVWAKIKPPKSRTGFSGFHSPSPTHFGRSLTQRHIPGLGSTQAPPPSDATKPREAETSAAEAESRAEFKAFSADSKRLGASSGGSSFLFLFFHRFFFF